ncbi:hypothetical protein BYT27DRAFT_7257201 [Phlegmacium glaucopus]|nr:hypothetical protein BYT27DRAFT_7257201 [Phlegmacium glaucopus]
MVGRIPCTCGCGREVTYATKQNHLNARGKTSLQARVVTETESLKRNTWQQQEPTPLVQRGSKKRASSNLDRDGSRKRLKAAPLEENQSPEITPSSQVDTDLIEDFLPPVMADTDRQIRFVERSGGVIEMRWTTSRQDSCSHSDGKGGNNDDGDEEEDKEDEDKDKDKEDEDKEERMRKTRTRKTRTRTRTSLLSMTLKYRVFLLGTCLAKTSSMKLQL